MKKTAYKRQINRIIIHCTATRSNTRINNIINYWEKVKKWKNKGYHILIDQYGVPRYIQNFNTVANGAKGYNSKSIHIAYIGGIDHYGKVRDTRTPSQQIALFEIIRMLKTIYPNAVVLGHRDLPNVKKECPCFNAKEEYKNIIY